MTGLAKKVGKSGRIRRSYQWAKLPVGPIPAICEVLPQAEFQAFKRRCKWAAAAMMLLAALQPLRTYADSIYFTYLSAKSELPTTAQLTGGTTTSVTANETFDARPTANPGTTFTTTYGAGGSIIGTFTGSFGINVADQYGGAGNIGKYISAAANATFILKFTNTAAVPGVNYFGLDIMALDAGNNLDIYRSGVRIATFNAGVLQKAVGACPNVSNPYCGNPTTAANAGEQYAFLNIFDVSGYFDELRFTQGSGGGFETDNFTAGYRNANALFGGYIEVPEPASTLLLLPGLAALVLLRYRAALSRFWPRHRKGYRPDYGIPAFANGGD